jgi:hypothetical protein
MSMPDVNIELMNGQLGRAVSEKDGVAAIIGSGIAVNGMFALGDILGPFYQVRDAEAKGINAKYDEENKLLLYQHIADFYKNAGTGAALYVMPVAQTVTLEEMADKDLQYAAKLIEQLSGEVRLVALTRVPDLAFEPVLTAGLDSDVIAAASKAQVLAVHSFDHFRPVSFLIEGRAFQGTVGDIADLRNEAAGPNANRVHVVISADNTRAMEDTNSLYYAHAGFALGRAAAIPVQRNLGRVRDGKLDIKNPGLSSGDPLNIFNETDLNVLNEKGYIFLRQHAGKAGYFFNDDHAACPIQDDYAYLNRGRVIDKAARLIRQLYLNDLLDELLVDKDGKLDIGVVKNFEKRGESHIAMNMRGQISNVEVFMNPDQNILATDETEVQLAITPLGTNRKMKIKLGFKNPAKI